MSGIKIPPVTRSIPGSDRPSRRLVVSNNEPVRNPTVYGGSINKKTLADWLKNQDDDQDVFIMVGGREVPLDDVAVRVTAHEKDGKLCVHGPTRIVLGRIEPPKKRGLLGWILDKIGFDAGGDVTSTARGSQSQSPLACYGYPWYPGYPGYHGYPNVPIGCAGPPNECPPNYPNTYPNVSPLYHGPFPPPYPPFSGCSGFSGARPVGFTGTGTYTHFTIVDGIVISAS